MLLLLSNVFPFCLLLHHVVSLGSFSIAFSICATFSHFFHHLFNKIFLSLGLNSEFRLFSFLLCKLTYFMHCSYTWSFSRGLQRLPRSPILLVKRSKWTTCNFVMVAFLVENERRAKEWLWEYQAGSSTNLTCLQSLRIIELLMIGQAIASFRYIWVMSYAWDYTETCASPPCSLLCSECWCAAPGSAALVLGCSCTAGGHIWC